MAFRAETAGPIFDRDFREQLLALFHWRRDVRRFRADPVDDDTLHRLIAAACLAPSVGLSQPWRFVIVDAPARREAIVDIFTRCNQDALAAYAPDAAAHYARLKLEGLRTAPRPIAIFADETTEQGRGLGRATMPEMARYSVVAAIDHLWLAARAEGIGMGWVSILEPAAVGTALDTPAAWALIGYFCLGLPETRDDTPELEREHWEHRRPDAAFVVRR